MAAKSTTKKAAAPKAVEAKETQPTFTKTQVVGSLRYKRFVDFLNGNLNADQMYSFEDIDAILAKHNLKG